MKKKRYSLFFLFFALYLSSNHIVLATSQNHVIDQFIKALIHRDERLMQSYVMETVEIPTIKKDTQINKVSKVPSPQKDTIVLVTYTKNKHNENQIAFIWALTTKNEKISYIQRIYDGTNPFLEEAQVVKEYEMKHHQNVLVPTRFPFEIHDFRSIAYNDYLQLKYYNEPTNGILKITISPIYNKLEHQKQKGEQFYTTKKGIKMLYKPNFHLAYELLFQKDNLQYKIEIGNKKYLKKTYTMNDLISIAESME